jgi:hypothetical protein
VWERKEAPARHEVLHVLNEPSSATPVTDGENVYVFFPDFGVVSYDAAGAVRWKKPMGPFNNRMGSSTSPIIAGSALVLVLDQIEGSEILALSLATGAVQWQVARKELDAWTTPPSTRRRDSRRRSSRPAAACSAATRSRAAPLWTHPGMAPAMVASPVVTGDTMVGFGYGYDSTPPFAEALAKSDKDGDGRLSIAECGTSAVVDRHRQILRQSRRVHRRERVARRPRRGPAPSSLVAVSLARDADGVVNARAVALREELRRGRASPLVLDGLVYTIKNGGILTVLRADTGEVVKTAAPARRRRPTARRPSRRAAASTSPTRTASSPSSAPARTGISRRRTTSRAAVRDARPVGRAHLRPRPEVAVQFRRALSTRRSRRMLSGTMLLRAVVLLLLAACLPPAATAQTPTATPPAASTGPVRVAIAGLVHGHVTGFMRRIQGRGADLELVGVYEPDAALRKAFSERYQVPEDKMFASLEDLLQRAKPEAVAAFSSTRDHRPIIEAAARAAST